MRLVAAFTFAVLLATVGADVAYADTFGADGAGLAQGFAHPIGGLDHVLAMLAVGLWAARIGRRALWRLPLAFPVVMAAGGALGWAGVGLPAVESGIAVSVVVLGLAVACAIRPPLWAGVAIVALFALFHGHAHGTELPVAAAPLAYAAGFVLATALLHVTGVGLGLIGRAPAARAALGLGGSAIAAAGLVLLIA